MSEVHRTLMESFVRLAKIAENPPDQAFLQPLRLGAVHACAALSVVAFISAYRFRRPAAAVRAARVLVHCCLPRTVQKHSGAAAR